MVEVDTVEVDMVVVVVVSGCSSHIKSSANYICCFYSQTRLNSLVFCCWL